MQQLDIGELFIKFTNHTNIITKNIKDNLYYLNNTFYRKRFLSADKKNILLLRLFNILILKFIFTILYHIRIIFQ